MNAYEIGIFLEHQGLSDDEIDAYFEHAGVKGMKWGVRRAQKLRANPIGPGRSRLVRNNARISVAAGLGLGILGGKFVMSRTLNTPLAMIAAGATAAAGAHAVGTLLEKSGKTKVSDIG